MDKAIALSGTIVMGLPIMIQHTEAERNKTHAGDGYVGTFAREFLLIFSRSIHLPPGASGHGATYVFCLFITMAILLKII